MGEDDTESMMMVEVAEEPEPVPGPQGPENGVPTAPPKKAPPAFNQGLKKKKQHQNKAPLPNKPQDLQVCVHIHPTIHKHALLYNTIHVHYQKLLHVKVLWILKLLFTLVQQLFYKESIKRGLGDQK